MDRIWLPKYPRGVPPDVDAAAYRSICEVFEQSTARFGSRSAFVSMGTALSFSALDRLTRDFAACLRGVLKLPRGARVALMMPNVLQYPVALFGVLRGGCTAVNCNPMYTVRELQHQLTDSGAEAVVVLENFASVVEKAIPSTQVRHVLVTGAGDLLRFPTGPVVNWVLKFLKRRVPAWNIPGALRFKDALRLGAGAPFERIDIGPDDLAFLQYTGGTTGVPKGAMLSHGNMIANLQQAHAWLRPVLEEGRETVITALPLYHVFALTANCMLFLKIGGTNVLIPDPRDIRGFVKELGRHRFTVITGVNTLFNALLNHPGFAALDFSPLRVALGGGMALQKSVAERWKQVTRKALLEGYGLTETSPVVTASPLDLPDYNGSIGLPLPSTDVAIRDEEGRDLPVGEVGELCVRGPQVMKGYWNKPAETAKVMMPDGYLRTGDLALVAPDGFVRIVDRKKDMLIVSGFKVFPNEIDDIVARCPGVLEAGTFGVPDPRSGQAVVVAVVRKDPALTAEAVIEHCRKYLTAYKVPRRVEFRESLPKSPIGKILRRALVEQAAAAP